MPPRLLMVVFSSPRSPHRCTDAILNEIWRDIIFQQCLPGITHSRIFLASISLILWFFCVPTRSIPRGFLWWQLAEMKMLAKKCWTWSVIVGNTKSFPYLEVQGIAVFCLASPGLSAWQHFWCRRTVREIACAREIFSSVCFRMIVFVSACSY